MGAWGVALFADDLAADIRDGFRDLIGDCIAVSAAVDKLRHQLSPAKRVPRAIKANSDGVMGEVVALRVAPGKWSLMRVIGLHVDEGGRFTVCELLDWLGDAIPRPMQFRSCRFATVTRVSASRSSLPGPSKNRARHGRNGWA